jgi:hypothetical protein
VHSAAHASDLVPLLLVVTLVLIGAMLLRRALALRTLAAASCSLQRRHASYLSPLNARLGQHVPGHGVGAE